MCEPNENLRRLVDGINSSADDEKLRLAHRMAKRMPLTHSLTSKAFGEVLDSGRLLSQRQLSTDDTTTAAPTTEEQLGTNDFVFLACGPFSHPADAHPGPCGLLWEADLEEDHKSSGEASPFDSGGILNHMTLPATYDSPQDYLDRHRLPIPGHRKYLEAKLGAFFPDPLTYLRCTQQDGCGVQDSVVALTGGDRRRWTHEVRIKRELPAIPHLRAVFLALPRLRSESGHLSRLPQSVMIMRYTIADNGPYAAMQGLCIDYIAAEVA